MKKLKTKVLSVACAGALCLGLLAGCAQSASEKAATDNANSTTQTQQQATQSEKAAEPKKKTEAAPEARSEKEAASTQADQSATDRVFTDMAGDEVIVSAEHDSVFTVNSVATQMVLMLGGPDAVATFGQGFDYADGSLNKAMFPDMGEKQPFTRDDVTVENVAAVDPGLVVIDVPDAVTTLRDAGIPAAFMSVNDASGLLDAADMMGAALGEDAANKAQAFRAFYEDMYNDVTTASASLAEDEKPKVLYLRSTTTTCGDQTMPNEWINAAGGINVAAEQGLTGARAEISTEAILEADPDAIVCERPEVAEELASTAAYADLQALANDKVYVAPFGTAVWSMGGAEAALQLPWAGTIINPELYSEFDMDGLTREFYQLMYGYDLTDDQLNSIFHR